MSAEISCHDTVAIKASPRAFKTAEWLILTLADSTGQEMQITAFFARKGDAQVYADAINHAFAVVEPPAVADDRDELEVRMDAVEESLRECV